MLLGLVWFGSANYPIATTPIIKASTLNLTPRQSHINPRHLPISYPDELPVVSSAPQGLARSLMNGLRRECTSLHARMTNSDGDERGYLKVPGYDVCMGGKSTRVKFWIGNRLPFESKKKKIILVVEYVLHKRLFSVWGLVELLSLSWTTAGKYIDYHTSGDQLEK